MASTNIYKVKGMHCASCASIIERTIRKIEGVEDISVNNGTEKAKISYDESKTSLDSFNQKLGTLGYTLESEKVDEHASHLGVNQTKHEEVERNTDDEKWRLGALPLAILSIFIMGWEIFGKYNFVH